MESSATPTSRNDLDAVQRAKDAENRLAALSSLLDSIDNNAAGDPLANKPKQSPHESQLVMARLGLASSLFIALRAKHAPTSAHCLRVALGASSWTLALGVPEELRDDIEVASLLHDVGKIGVPDHILLKPGKLSGEEVLLMERHRQLGCEILSGCCTSRNVLDIVRYIPARYDGTKHGFDRAGEDLPFGSRLIKIVDAFDAMTTDHVYRRAMSRERAVAELFEHAGTQFDPQLVKRFCDLMTQDQIQFTEAVSRRWLHQITVDASNRYWSLSDVAPGDASATRQEVSPHYERLLDAMHDAVVFVDEQCCVTVWNRAAERLTGISAQSMVGSTWTPDLVRLKDERGKTIPDEECPIAHAMRSGTQSFRRLTLLGRKKERVSADVHVAPVLRGDGSAKGATVILHDASSQITLEERVESLNERATQDPLTKLSNRAEFDRGLVTFVKNYFEQGESCSMIICDIDHFKKINDVHGHQAGDEALILFAGVLQSHSRDGDLVARYGGEEFVVLCADCDNATATQRAELLRRAVSERPQPSLGNKCVTASFGVTEVQGGDTPETFLNRADRALLQAKANGRNMVVQLGTGIGEEERRAKTSGWLNWFQSSPADELLSRRLVTVVPMNVAAEKLRGFVADHKAQILEIHENCVTVKIEETQSNSGKRASDRAVPFLMELTFEEESSGTPQRGAVQQRTLIRVVIRPRRQRDRRRNDMIERARQLLVSVKSYLMAHEYVEESSETGSHDSADKSAKKKKALSHWLSG
ncbi:MAG: diguanylate cyclase [Planctomycetaceae bacterium]|nr:diguanylate cyclase [Planctomycetales bacterium]MCB9924472.1 diguanylate cyclase [Planctomycetaceae bacterium]